MQIVQGNKVPKTELDNVRGGSVFIRSLLRGEGGPEHFSLVVYYMQGDFHSPRHHHNFDQFRYQLEGFSDYDQDGKMSPGTLGYFPEGAFYGPTIDGAGEPTVTATFQFGGASGSGYMDIEQVKEAREALKAKGTFDKGVYRRSDDLDGTRSQDAGDAMFEYIHAKPRVYPDPQYDKPIMINTHNFPWRTLPATGVAERSLGTFTSACIRTAQYRLLPGATHEAVGRGMYLTLSGKGRVGDQPLADLTAMYLDEGEVVSLRAEDLTEVLFVGLPSRASMTDTMSSPVSEPAAV